MLYPLSYMPLMMFSIAPLPKAIAFGDVKEPMRKG